jgi:hypothetical protein
MKTYTIHLPPSKSLENAVFVKEGFSLWAALFQGFWALYHKMWLCAAALIVANMCLFLLAEHAIITGDVLVILRLGLFVYIGFEANDWRRLSLSKNGYELVDVISGKDESEAKFRFFAGYVGNGKAGTV